MFEPRSDRASQRSMLLNAEPPSERNSSSTGQYLRHGSRNSRVAFRWNTIGFIFYANSWLDSTFAITGLLSKKQSAFAVQLKKLLQATRTRGTGLGNGRLISVVPVASHGVPSRVEIEAVKQTLSIWAEAPLQPGGIREVHKTLLVGLSRGKELECEKPPWSPQEADNGGVNVYCELQIFS